MQKKRRAPNRTEEAARDRSWADDIFAVPAVAQDDHPVRKKYLRNGWIIKISDPRHSKYR